MLQPQRWVNFKLSQAHPSVDVIRIDKLNKAPWWIGFFLQFQQIRKRLLSSKGISDDVEVTGLVELYLDPKDIPLFEHKVLMPLVAADRHSKVFFAPQVRIIALLLFEADL